MRLLIILLLKKTYFNTFKIYFDFSKDKNATIIFSDSKKHKIKYIIYATRFINESFCINHSICL